ncbi:MULTISPECIES: hypothetical protein [unclassified Streptomyces]|uniref:hypothetical protein n=1 Tax=unclassified Streptomyces TaxID=2593676 RepID=UPI0004C96A6B|nr:MULTISPECIES: hypothetical protein [unclassified Streptomyces]KOV86112.1 hypothetical protein ADL02_19700 [Streptomyces sp. NRRL WC-3723]
MASNPTSQLSAATALVELLTEHPDLSDHVSWSINRINPALTGYILDGGMDVLAECAAVLGGSIRAGDEYRRDGRRVRQHVLKATWRDVPVVVLVSAPVRSLAVAV